MYALDPQTLFILWLKVFALLPISPFSSQYLYFDIHLVSLYFFSESLSSFRTLNLYFLKTYYFRERESSNRGRGRGEGKRGREADSLLSREPHANLGSIPGS